MENLQISGTFLKLTEKSGNAKTSGKPYSFVTLRAVIDGEVLDFSVDLEKVEIADLRALKSQDEVSLEIILLPSGKAGYEALEPRVKVVACATE